MNPSSAIDLASVSPFIPVFYTHSPSQRLLGSGPEPGGAGDTPMTNDSPAPGARGPGGKAGLGSQTVQGSGRAGLGPGSPAGRGRGCVGVRGRVCDGGSYPSLRVRKRLPGGRDIRADLADELQISHFLQGEYHAVLTCNSLITKEREHVFVSLLALCVLSVVNRLLISFAHFLNGILRLLYYY